MSDNTSASATAAQLGSTTNNEVPKKKFDEKRYRDALRLVLDKSRPCTHDELDAAEDILRKYNAAERRIDCSYGVEINDLAKKIFLAETTPCEDYPHCETASYPLWFLDLENAVSQLRREHFSRRSRAEEQEENQKEDKENEDIEDIENEDADDDEDDHEHKRQRTDSDSNAMVLPMKEVERKKCPSKDCDKKNNGKMYSFEEMQQHIRIHHPKVVVQEKYYRDHTRIQQFLFDGDTIVDASIHFGKDGVFDVRVGHYMRNAPGRSAPTRYIKITFEAKDPSKTKFVEEIWYNEFHEAYSKEERTLSIKELHTVKFELV